MNAVIDHLPILLVDDNETDAFLMAQAFQKAGIQNPIVNLRDGESAIDYLSGTGAYIDRSQCPLPLFMLLDTQMPRKNGFEVLAWLQSQPELKRLIVIVLTSSIRDEDINLAYDLGANSYVVKPASLDDLIEIVRTMYRWFHVNSFPSIEERLSATMINTNHQG